jgi:hypothetical protein
MHDFVGVLEGHWPTHFVSVTYSAYFFQRPFFQTTWYHPFFPNAVKVEVVDVPLNYNLLLGRSWTYAMHAVFAIVFWVFLFPHEGQIVSIHQLYFSCPDHLSRASTVPMIDTPQLSFINIRVGLCPPFLGTFNYPPPFGAIKLISAVPNQPRAGSFQVLSFHMTYFIDLWTLPSPSTMMEGRGHHGMDMPLSVVEVAYSIVQQASTNPHLTLAHEVDLVLEPIWA